MKKILLLNPPPIHSRNYFKCIVTGGKSYLNTIYTPLNLAYIASLLRKEINKNDISIDLLDANASNYSLQKLKKHIIKTKPDILIIDSINSSYVSDVYIAKLIKNLMQNIEVIFTGIFATSNWFTVMKEKIIDLVIVGEPELTSLELLKNRIYKSPPLHTIKGVVWRGDDGKIIKNHERPLIQNLDELPFPARDLLPLKKYKQPLGKYHPATDIKTSRGCIHNCLFCGSKITYKRKWRGRSPKNVVDEMQEIKEKYKINEIWVMEDQFLSNRGRALEICNEIIRRNLDISWVFNCRVNEVDLHLLRKLKKAGCHRIDYGIESANDKIRKILRKGITKEMIKNAFKLTKEAGIRTGALVVTGFPGETWKTVKETAKFIKEIDVDIAICHIATPYPGTDFYNVAKRNKWIINRNLGNYNMCECVISYPDFNSQDIKKALQWSITHFYLNFPYIFKQITNINSLTDLKVLIRYSFSYLVLIKNFYTPKK